MATTATTDAVSRSLTAEMPRTSASFVDSAGINVHLSYYGTLYGNNFTTIASLLTGLGVHHVRDSAVPGQDNICQEDRQLAASGIHVEVIASLSQSMSDIASWLACVGSAAEAVEGPNEYDLSGDPNWPATLTAYQQTLYAQFHSMLPVVGPALTAEWAYGSVSLAGAADAGNMHDYFAGRNPGTPGWGGTDGFGTYGSLPYAMAVAHQDTGGAPIEATETGYSDSTDTYAVPTAVKAHYVLRTLLEHWNAGVPRTYFYELVDEGGAPFSHYGLATSAGKPKAAYSALQNLLKLLADGTNSFTPTALSYGFTASTAVHHMLLQKQSGVYELVVWVEAPEWDPNANQAIAISPQTVTITFAKRLSTLALSSFEANGTVKTTAKTASTNISLQATGAPVVLTITP